MEEKEGVREERIKAIAISYYSRPDIRKNMFEFSKNREIAPRYFETFGKRPSILNYPSDIIELAKSGWVSFHCSEELWSDPLQLSTGMSENELNELREGWDLLLDIDCKYIEYSKKAAQALIKSLEFHGVKNIGIKFSGSKGFHIIVPWNAFPKEIYGQLTKEMFPEWPRMICSYLTEVARPVLEKEMEKEDIKFTSHLENGMMCLKCKNISEEIIKRTLRCPKCKREETSEIRVNSKDKPLKCPDCRIEMTDKERKVFYNCPKCNINSTEDPNNFRSSIDIFKVLGVDVILVSSRHFFRMPYSLHEKTSLASVVLDKSTIEDFKLRDADPLRVQVKDFYPKAEENEAHELLLQAIDWNRSKIQEKEPAKEQNYSEGKYKEIIIKNLSPSLYPPCILNILKGLKQDGRKRALFVLINFFKSLKLTDEELKKTIEEWNKKNAKPLKQGYVNAQLKWFSGRKPLLPPNCDKEHYKAVQACTPDSLCKSVKNPVNYTVKKSFLNKNSSKNVKKTNQRD